jgi:divalent metal cation (Fe/Co/Zn/Cd) transporter
MTTDRKFNLRRAYNLEVFTVGYNVVEAAIAVSIGVLGNSVALVAFGMDSLIEVTAAVILGWRLKAEMDGRVDTVEDIERIERKASWWVGVTFMLLAVYVVYESGESLYGREQSNPGPVGIALSAISVIIMPILWRKKLSAADALGSPALRSEAAETVICAYLSGILLAGILLNEYFGLWWADSVAALFMVYFIVKEGFEAFAMSRGECGCCGASCGTNTQVTMKKMEGPDDKAV